MALETVHSHSLKELKTQFRLKMEPLMKHEINGNVYFKDRSKRFLNYIGSVFIGKNGKTYSINSNLVQKSNQQFIHMIEMLISDGTQHKIETIYKIPDSRHEFTSYVNLQDVKPIKLQSKFDLHPNHFQAFGSVTYRKNVYSVDARSKASKSQDQQKWDVIIDYPERQITLTAGTLKSMDKYSGKAVLNWDSRRKATKNHLISVDGFFRYSELDSYSQVNGELNVVTPFKHYQLFKSHFRFTDNDSNYDLSGRLSWGKKSYKTTSNLIITKPVTFSNMQMKFEARTPSRNFKEIGLEVNHHIDDKLLNFITKILNKHNPDIHTHTGWLDGDISGHASLKTPFAAVRDLSVSVNHNHQNDDGKSSGSAAFTFNNRKYITSLENEIVRSMHSKGKLNILWPEDGLETSWNHKFTDFSNIQSFFTTKSKSDNKNFIISFKTNSNGDKSSTEAQGTMHIGSSWKTLNGTNIQKSINVQFNHVKKDHKVKNTLETYVNNKQHTFIHMMFDNDKEQHSAEFKVMTPVYADTIAGHWNIKHTRHPLTVNSRFEWSQKSHINFDGFIDMQSLEDIEISAILKTPFENCSKMNAKVSHKLVNGEYSTNSKLVYGNFTFVDFENKIRIDDSNIMFRTKLITPLHSMEKFNSGFEFLLKPSGIEGKIDFELKPLVEKHQTTFKIFINEKSTTGKLYLTAPNTSFKTLKLIGQRKNNYDGGQTMSIYVKPETLGLYSLEVTISMMKSFLFDINLKTPHVEFKHIGFMLYHRYLRNKGISSKLRVRYLPSQEVISKFDISWHNNIDAILVVSTPFERFEHNVLKLSHYGEFNNLTSYIKAEIGTQRTVGDFRFFHGNTNTIGTLNLVTPIQGFEKIQGNLEIRRNVSCIIGNMTMLVNKDVFKSSFSNQYTVIHNRRKEGLYQINEIMILKSNFDISTPLTRDFGLHVNFRDQRIEEERKWIQESLFNVNYGNNIKGHFNYVISTIPDLHYKNGHVSLEVKTPFEILNSFKSSIEISDISLVKKVSQTDAKFTTKWKNWLINEKSHDVMNTTSIIFSDMDSNFVAKIVASLNSIELINATFSNRQNESQLQSDIKIKGGLIPKLSAKIELTGDLTNFETKMKMNADTDYMFESNISFMIDDKMLNISSNSVIVLGKGGQTIVHTFDFKEFGDMEDLNIIAFNTFDSSKISAEFHHSVQSNNISSLLHINGLRHADDTVGFVYDQSGIFENFTMNGKILLSEKDSISVKSDFAMVNKSYVMASTELSTPFKNFESSKVQYHHKSIRMNPISINVVFKSGFHTEIMTYFTSSSNGSLNLNFNLKTSFEKPKDTSLIFAVKLFSNPAEFFDIDMTTGYMTIEGKGSVTFRQHKLETFVSFKDIKRETYLLKPVSFTLTSEPGIIHMELAHGPEKVCFYAIENYLFNF